MNIEDFAWLLNGRGIDKEITPEEEKFAKELGYVAVFGASDDLAEFRGAIYDEVGCYGGTDDIYVTANGIVEELECHCKYALAVRKTEIEKAKRIEAIWDAEGYSWIYKTDIPHATFDIMEDGEKYCRGIVFDLNATFGETI